MLSQIGISKETFAALKMNLGVSDCDHHMKMIDLLLLCVRACVCAVHACVCACVCAREREREGEPLRQMFHCVQEKEKCIFPYLLNYLPCMSTT